jgi:hypothetical protein
LGTDLIVRTDPIGPDYVIISTELAIEGQLADLEDLSHRGPQRHGPNLITIRIPVGRDDRREGEIPGVRQVVVDERLECQEIYRRAAVISSIGPEVVGQSPKQYGHLTFIVTTHLPDDKVRTRVSGLSAFYGFFTHLYELLYFI